MTTTQLEALVSEATGRVLARTPLPAGMGQEEDILAKISAAGNVQEIAAVREAVSPWLWILSCVGFVMTTMNTKRIAKMVKGKA